MNIQANLFDTSKFLEEKTEYKVTDPAWDVVEEKKEFDIGQRLYFGNVENQCILISKNPYKVKFWNGKESIQNNLNFFEDATCIKRVLMVGDLITIPIEAKVNKRQIHLHCTKGVVIEFLPKNKVLIDFQKLPLGPETHKICLNSLTLVRGWEQDSRLRAYNSEDLKLLDSQKLTNTVVEDLTSYTQQLITSETSTKSQNNEISKKNRISSPHHLPVSHSASKESDFQPQITETVSPHSSKLSNSTDQNIPASKTLPDFSIAPLHQEAIAHISSISLKSFSEAGTMSNGDVCQAEASPVPLIENDYCWLPAPTALSTKNSRPPGLSKLETFLKQKGLINKGEVIDPAILSEWFGIPTSWLDPWESRTAIQILENSAAQQVIFSTPELQQLHSEELSISNLAPDKSCPQCGAWLNPHKDSCQVCGWEVEKFLEENKQLKIGDRVKILNKNFGEFGLITKVLKIQEHGWVVIDSNKGTYHSSYLELIPENFLEEKGKNKKRSQSKKRRNKKGSLYKYLENKKLKDGRVTSYPRITSNFRDPENPHHWRWGYHWDEKIDGKWKGRSIGSIPPGVIGYIKDMRSRNVQIEEIISFIKKAKRKK